MVDRNAPEPWLAPAISEYEKLGFFYLGRPYDLEADSPSPGLTLYDSADLVTHAVCVGMTGSGKTGLCVSLIEEAALDGVPTIAIDPKGDLGNLLLTFPELRPEDFRPWVNEGDAKRKSVSPDEFARQQSELWRGGLASWGQDGDRIGRLREAADFTIFTPGSTAGVPVSILASFGAPPAAIRDDRELLLERVGFTTTSLLGLLGIDADPVKSREHILTSHILSAAWKSGQDLDLASLISQIIDPPMRKVGVVDLDSFFSSGDRHELAMSLNNLLAAPSFATWLDGEPLDVGKMLYGPDGKPRVSIFSIAHLPEAERMFFVSLLLSQVVSWVRTQSGTTSLRALLYMDEVFGYFPPVAEPPSKRPLLTLLKQARAHGLGVMLATQNPADLDYKGLSNAGTWFLGRLQTERDKKRVIEGLKGVAATGGDIEKLGIETVLSALDSRVFLMNNVHEDGPVIFQTRWAMSYLRGPLTRPEIRTLMSDRPRPEAIEPSTATVESSEPKPTTRPVLPPSINQFFLPIIATARRGDIVYRPMLLGSADIRFVDKRLGIDVSGDRIYLTPVSDGPVPVDWDRAQALRVPLADLRSDSEAGAVFAALPVPAAKARSHTRWRSDFGKWLHRNAVLDANQIGREQREAIVAKVREKYRAKVDRIMEKIRNLKQTVEKEADRKRAEQLDAIVSAGSSVLGALFGRRRSSRSSSRRSRSRTRSASSRRRAEHAQEDLEAAVRELDALRRTVETEINNLDFAVRPTKSNVDVEAMSLVWAPFAKGEEETFKPAWE